MIALIKQLIAGLVACFIGLVACLPAWSDFTSVAWWPGRSHSTPGAWWPIYRPGGLVAWCRPGGLFLVPGGLVAWWPGRSFGGHQPGRNIRGGTGRPGRRSRRPANSDFYSTRCAFLATNYSRILLYALCVFGN
jgi:hypothetical protein